MYSKRVLENTHTRKRRSRQLTLCPPLMTTRFINAHERESARARKSERPSERPSELARQGWREGDGRIANPGASPEADVPKGRCSGMPASQGWRLTTGAPGTPAVALEYGPALLYITLLKNSRRTIYE